MDHVRCLRTAICDLSATPSDRIVKRMLNNRINTRHTRRTEHHIGVAMVAGTLPRKVLCDMCIVRDLRYSVLRSIISGDPCASTSAALGCVAVH